LFSSATRLLVGFSKITHVLRAWPLIFGIAGIKFILLATPEQSDSDLDRLLRQVYELHADFVLKNPFYEMDMPIKCELFDTNLNVLVRGHR
jgi:hypothetical protein